MTNIADENCARCKQNNFLIGLLEDEGEKFNQKKGREREKPNSRVVRGTQCESIGRTLTAPDGQATTAVNRLHKTANGH